MLGPYEEQAAKNIYDIDNLIQQKHQTGVDDAKFKERFRYLVDRGIRESATRQCIELHRSLAKPKQLRGFSPLSSRYLVDCAMLKPQESERQQRISDCLIPPESTRDGLPISTRSASGHVELPCEILHMILLHVDAPTLISFSQTCHLFWAIAQPSRFHHLQRLLAWELDPERGGLIPKIDPNRMDPLSKLVPALDDEAAWANTCYACSGCLRLRHHRWFDTHSILGLQYRKPPPDHPAGDTTAEPGNARERWRRRRLRVAEGREPLGLARWSTHKPMIKQWRRLHTLSRWIPVDDSEGQKTLQTELCGYQRHRRLCIECQYTRGKYEAKLDIFDVGQKPGMWFHSSTDVHDVTKRGSNVVYDDEKPIATLRPEYLGLPKDRSCMRRCFGGRSAPEYHIRCKKCDRFKGLLAFRREVDVFKYNRTWNMRYSDWNHSLPEHRRWHSDWLCTSCIVGGELGEALEKFKQERDEEVNSYVKRAKKFHLKIEPQHRLLVIQQMVAGVRSVDGRIILSDQSIGRIGKRAGIEGLGGLGPKSDIGMLHAVGKEIAAVVASRRGRSR